jgi:hypothetical protein
MPFYQAQTDHTATTANRPDQGTADWAALPVLTYRDMVAGAGPDFRPVGPEDVVTTVAYTFRDRDRLFHRNGDQATNLRSLVITGNQRRTDENQLDLITRPTQAKRWAVEAARQLSEPGMEARLQLRWPAVRAKGIREGGYAVLDIQTEPGGDSDFRVFRVVSLDREGDRVSAILRLETAFGGEVANAVMGPDIMPGTTEPSAIVHRQVFSLPPQLFDGDTFGAGFLASRPDAITTDFAVHHDNDPAGDFPLLGRSRSFAMFGFLVEDATSWGAGVAYEAASDWTIGETLVAGDKRTFAGRVWNVVTGHTTSSSDLPTTSAKWESIPLRFALYDAAELYRFQAGIADAAQRNDELLLVVMKKASPPSDYIDVGAEGAPYLEIFSVGAVTALGTTENGPSWDPDPLDCAVYEIDVLRSRFGTTARDWDEHSEAWLVFKDELPKFSHTDFERAALLGETSYFRFVPSTSRATRSTEDTPAEFDFTGADGFTPRVTWVTPGNKDVVGTTTATGVAFEGYVTDQNANLTGVTITRRQSDSTTETTILSALFGITSRYDFSFTADFTEGTHFIVVTATDLNGNESRSVRIVIVEPAAGIATIVATPDLSPQGGHFAASLFPITVTATCDTAAADIEMQVTSTAVNIVPVSGWSAVTSLDITAGQRVWVKATKSGLTDSEVANWTYQY